jgi:UDP-N-acetylmuramoylalanine--D-glutamate ligase
VSRSETLRRFPARGARLAGHRAVVIGLATSGRAAAEALMAEGASVRISESKPAEALIDMDPPAGAELLAGGHRPEHLDGATVLVVSPGVPERAEVLRWARERRIPIWSELELGARLCTVPFVAVTGTNGKTTTVELVAAAMRAEGLEARACGNVGYPFSTAALERHGALAVEASSFQLRFTIAFHPRVSILLNLAPDHLDWHGSFERYREAKARIFANQRAGDTHVGNRDDAQAADTSRAAPCPVLWFREREPDPGEVGVAGDLILARGFGQSGGDVEVGPASLDAPRFRADAAAATAACLAFGLSPEAMSTALASFDVPPHRGQRAGEVRGVRFLNDSKATNPHAALASLRGLEHVVLIAGGLSKGVDLSPLASAAEALDGVVAIGQAAPEIQRVFHGLVPVEAAGSVDEAVERAYAMATPNRTVLLAPACASQDMFVDYQDRGERFAAAVRDLAARIRRRDAN